MKERTDIVDKLAILCKELIDDYSFIDAMAILKAIIGLDETIIR